MAIDEVPIAAPAPHVAAQAPQFFIFPETGEALLTDKDVAACCRIGTTTVWDLVKNDPAFPQPVRTDGKRFTRWKLSEVRTYIKNLETGTPKPKPVPRQRIRDIDNDFRELR